MLNYYIILYYSMYSHVQGVNEGSSAFDIGTKVFGKGKVL